MDGWLPKRALCSQCAVNIRASAQWGEMPVYGDVDLFVRREVSILDPYLVQVLLVLRSCHALLTLDWDITYFVQKIYLSSWKMEIFFYLQSGLFTITTFQKLWLIWPAQKRYEEYLETLYNTQLQNKSHSWIQLHTKKYSTSFLLVI